MSLSPASINDVEHYRTYLATHNPIAEIETRFLDPAEDLICLDPNGSQLPEYSPSYSYASSSSGGLLTPMPHKSTFSDPNHPHIFRETHSRSTSSSSLPPPSLLEPQGGEVLHLPSRHFEDPATGAEYQADDNTTMTTPTQTRPSTPREVSDDGTTAHPFGQNVILASFAIVLPILTFLHITNSADSITVIFLAGLAVIMVARKLVMARFR